MDLSKDACTRWRTPPRRFFQWDETLGGDPTPLQTMEVGTQ
jgi:hypothetical protein